jgi:hypothetical protein
MSTLAVARKMLDTPRMGKKTPLEALTQVLRNKYGLLPAEITMLISRPPTTRTELCMVVEEGEERYDESVLDEMVALVQEGTGGNTPNAEG